MKKSMRLILVLLVCLAALLTAALRIGAPGQPILTQPPTALPTQTPSHPVTVPPTTAPEATEPDMAQVLTEILQRIPVEEQLDISFMRRFLLDFGDDTVLKLRERLEAGYDRSVWYELTGNSYHGLRFDENRENYHLISRGNLQNEDTTLVFGGDICLADNYLVMEHLASVGGSIDRGIDPALAEIFRKADVAYLVNEFTISNRGAPMEGKAYTFRAKTANAAIYQQLGIDLVSLANNHVFDFGEEAFRDTLNALKENGVAYIGGGEDLEEAKLAQYYLINGRVIGFVAATRAEKYIMTPEAGEDSPGVLRCYDTALFAEAIREAKRNSDYVVACVHWGTEYSYDLETAQTASAREYIDAGADAIIGSHPHQLQGIEFYNGKPIFYSLGNFWFNSYEIDTGLVEITVDREGTAVYRFLPALQKDCYTSSQIGTGLGRLIIEKLNQYCIGAEIAADGTVFQRN